MCEIKCYKDTTMLSLNGTSSLHCGSSKMSNSNGRRSSTLIRCCKNNGKSLEKRIVHVRDDLENLLKFTNENCTNSAVTRECKVAWCEIENLSATLSDLKFKHELMEIE